MLSGAEPTVGYFGAHGFLCRDHPLGGDAHVGLADFVLLIRLRYLVVSNTSDTRSNHLMRVPSVR
jgi:hypothetical protein